MPWAYCHVIFLRCLTRAISIEGLGSLVSAPVLGLEFLGSNVGVEDGYYT